MACIVVLAACGTATAAPPAVPVDGTRAAEAPPAAVAEGTLPEEEEPTTPSGGDGVQAPAEESRSDVTVRECPEPAPRIGVPDYVFGGRVVDAGDRPVRRAHIAVYARAFSDNLRSPCVAEEASGSTDADGRFELSVRRLTWYDYPRWIEATAGDLHARRVLHMPESNRDLRLVAHRTRAVEIEVRCARFVSAPGADERLPPGPALSVFSGSETRDMMAIPLRPTPAPDVFRATVRLRRGHHHLAFTGACGMHGQDVNVRWGSEPMRVEVELPRVDAGNLEVAFAEPGFSVAHVLANGYYALDIERNRGQQQRFDGVAPGRYRFEPYWEPRQRDCVHTVDVLPGQTTHVDLRFDTCELRPRGWRPIGPQLR